MDTKNKSKATNLKKKIMGRLKYYEGFSPTAYNDKGRNAGLTIGYGIKIDSYQKLQQLLGKNLPFNEQEWKTLDVKSKVTKLANHKIDESLATQHLENEVNKRTAKVEAWLKKEKWWDGMSEQQKIAINTAVYANGLTRMQGYEGFSDAMKKGNYKEAMRQLRYHSNNIYNIKRVKGEMCDFGNLSGNACDIEFQKYVDDVKKDKDKDKDKDKHKLFIEQVEKYGKIPTSADIDKGSKIKIIATDKIMGGKNNVKNESETSNDALSLDTNNEAEDASISDAKPVKEVLVAMDEGRTPDFNPNLKDRIASDTSTPNLKLLLDIFNPAKKEDDLKNDTVAEGSKGKTSENLESTMTKVKPKIEEALLEKDPKQMTENEVKILMNSPAFNEKNNPLYKQARRASDTWYKDKFPGKVEYDETGRMKRTDPVNVASEESPAKSKEGFSMDGFMSVLGAGLDIITKVTDKALVVENFQKSLNQMSNDDEPTLKVDGIIGEKQLGQHAE